MNVQQISEQIIGGLLLNREQARELAREAVTEELLQAADTVRLHFHGQRFDLCSIINARSGRCSEDCRYCAQSARYQTEITEYDCIPLTEALAQARALDACKVKRLSLVTAGHSLSREQLEEQGQIYQELAQVTGLLFCASMGFLTPGKAQRLREFGVVRYHCNLESCREFFPRICTTHSWEDKVRTLEVARAAGLELCSGGIIGMGETVEHRLELALELRELDVLSIPINILTPIPGTPLADLQPLTPDEVFRCLALFRLINPLAVIRLAGGRDQLGTDQYSCFVSGANGAIVGDYLTTSGSSLSQDIAVLSALEFDLRRD
ncbi:MAG: biotin synthase BioB [Desulfobulbaceae bacterium]|uniref:Biotin synthase n=1 Tax=Candidatus Desulfatifera sulfidica TaxID=2841691 RepID=A0A8J6NB26_9BACT|nr:biotin synthase BioB [Candidatus Desulfatifera sulfidica]